jgi:hypothetical protein
MLVAGILSNKMFTELKFLTLHLQHTFSLLLFIVKNTGMFKSSFEVHTINTHNASDLHPP